MTMRSNTRMCSHLWCKSKLITTRYVAHADAKVQHPVPAHACTRGQLPVVISHATKRCASAHDIPPIALVQLKLGGTTGNHSKAQEKLRHGDRDNIAG